MLNRSLFTSDTWHWQTPPDLLAELTAEFNFNDDPCPLNSAVDGLARAWGSSTFVNPPYGRTIAAWVEKAYTESRAGKTVVMLIPARTDTRYWHDYVMRAAEVRLVRGRLKFLDIDGNSAFSAPFPSAIVIFRLHKTPVKKPVFISFKTGEPAGVQQRGLL